MDHQILNIMLPLFKNIISHFISAKIVSLSSSNFEHHTITSYIMKLHFFTRLTIILEVYFNKLELEIHFSCKLYTYLFHM